jgi:hypothetical protein
MYETRDQLAGEARIEAALSAPPELNLDLGLAFADPRPKSLLALWRAKRQGPRLPRRADFDPLALKPHLGWLCIAEVLPGRDDLCYRLIGSAIVDIVGRDVTGRRVSEVMPPAALDVFGYLMRHPRPARTYGTVAWCDKGFVSHETLLLPLADDGATVDRFLIEMLFPADLPAPSRRPR